MSEQKENCAKFEQLLDIIQEKYNIKRDALFSKINRKDVDFKINYYKEFNPDEFEFQVEAICANSHRDPNIDVIVESINQYINECKEKQTENTSNKYTKNISLSTNEKELLNSTAKISYITTNQKISYNSYIVYNEGHNQNDKKLNSQIAEIEIKKEKLLEPYPLIPEDFSNHRDAFKEYFIKKRDKLLEELKIDSRDVLLGQTKFVLFISFDIIDMRPTINDIIGIDPLNDYQKYKIKFDVNENMDFFLTSGQIVYIEGTLREKNIIEADKLTKGFKIIEYSMPEISFSKYYSSSNEPYAIYYLNGPFCPKEILDYGVFFDVLKELVSKNPHLLIINGPFFSGDNDAVKSCKFDIEEEMKNIFFKINKMFSETRTKIYICPGISDIENYYPLPQPPFDKLNDVYNYKNDRNTKINFISNPQIFNFNEAIINIANFDVLKDIISNSVYTTKTQTLDKACDMILAQQNLYPVMTNTINTSYENSMEKITTIDLMKYDYLSFDENPDIILTNSALKNFAKRYKGTIFVNCGSFVKGKNFGEVGKITIHSVKEVEDIEFYKRVKVEFIKVKGDLNKILENHGVSFNKDSKNKIVNKSKVNNITNKKNNDEDVEMKDVHSKK